MYIFFTDQDPQVSSRRVRRASAKEAVVDLVSDTSEVGEDDRLDAAFYYT